VLVIPFEATAEKAGVLFHILLDLLTVLKRFNMGLARLATDPSQLIALTWRFSSTLLANERSVSYTTDAVRDLAEVLREVPDTFLITERRLGNDHTTEGDYFRLLRYSQRLGERHSDLHPD
jgi:hypothetical protein